MRNLGRLLLRASVGGFFIGHGTQKLFGWFGGHGLEGTAAFFEQLGMRPGKRNALAAGLAEAGGGAALLVGAATPLAASALTATMLTAVHRVHLKNGPWSTNGGYEYNAVLIAAVLTLAETGPGPLSVDAARGAEHTGGAWALAALLAGVAGAAGAHVLAEATPPAPEPPATPEPSVPSPDANPATA
jgi:putative oxidoreductase